MDIIHTKMTYLNRYELPSHKGGKLEQLKLGYLAL